jgi:hypothetical protein
MDRAPCAEDALSCPVRVHWIWLVYPASALVREPQLAI